LSFAQQTILSALIMTLFLFLHRLLSLHYISTCVPSIHAYLQYGKGKKIFHSNIVLNRHYCQHTSVVNRQYRRSHGYNIVKYFIATVLNRHYCQHTSVLCQQTILWLSWVQYCKIFHSNIVLNRHYCQHMSVVNRQYCGYHGYNIITYFIAI